MGMEARCAVRLGDETGTAKVLLETEELIVRGGPRGKIPLRAITSVKVADGWLLVAHPKGDAAFELGDEAPRWAERIRSPKDRAKKLGVGAGARVVLLRIDDATIAAELAARGADVAQGRPRKNADAIFLGVRSRDDLARLPSLAPYLKPRGALWVVRPKGVPEVTERDVLGAARAAGLVDVKVVKFSDTHTAEKLVVPHER